MQRFLSILFVMGICSFAMPAHANDTAISPDMPQGAAGGTNTALDTLSPSEQKAVRTFLAKTGHVHLILADIISYLDEGDVQNAVGLVVETYHTKKRMAQIVVLLVAQANGKPVNIVLAKP